MGYGIFTHLVGAQPDIDTLRAALPASLEPQVYKHRSADVWGINVVPAPWKPHMGFGSSGFTSKDIPYELPAHLSELQAVYDTLSRAGSAGALHRGSINVSELLSGALNQRVVSVRSDDNASDYVVISDAGRVSSFEGLVGDFIVHLGAGQPTTVTAVDEDAHDELHKHAAEVIEREFGLSTAETGMGTFDAPQDYNFLFVTSSPPRGPTETPQSPTPKTKKASGWKRLFGLG